jgi:copper ion binding protein
MSSVYSVSGMTCDHCRAAVESHVGAVPGVTAVAVDVARGTVLVEGQADDALVRDAIVEAGYEVG